MNAERHKQLHCHWAFGIRATTPVFGNILGIVLVDGGGAKQNTSQERWDIHIQHARAFILTK